MEIRRATVADYDRLVAFDTLASSAPERRDHIKTWIGTDCCYVAEIGELVGAYGVLNYHFFGNGFIEMVMVGEDFRRKGLGIGLVRYFKEICETPKLFASTNQSNQQMQKLLNSAGFRTSGFIDNLDENDPEIVFCFHAP
ncbi:GNAT family N-acetyltransferase [Agrobacterium vitis]|uniref:GNAT family N-acetyltransferase n=1 Tax=Agrobacterium vitis TaxID=373 RepID=A0A6L6VKF9_AGRVI|nr:GNAT family N-acetyltransferase [Agrobacterium vitis]MUZ76280.1 GNAT family N-acetyltransferase [Agrobacterium vitis]